MCAGISQGNSLLNRGFFCCSVCAFRSCAFYRALEKGRDLTLTDPLGALRRDLLVINTASGNSSAAQEVPQTEEAVHQICYTCGRFAFGSAWWQMWSSSCN